MQMCQAFASVGADVTFVHPSYGKLHKQVVWEEIESYYGLSERFDIVTLPSLQSRISSVPQVGVASMIGAMTGWILKQTLAGIINRTDIIYGRNYYGMCIFNELRRILPRSRRPVVVFEHHHDISAHFKYNFFSRIDGLVCITEALKRRDQEVYGVDNCFVAPDGVDLSPYESVSKAEARDTIGIPREERVVMYTGHLYPSKGVDELVRAAADIDATVYVVGGYKEDIERVRAVAGERNNVVLTGFVEPRDIPRYQIAADVLVAPYTSDARNYLSPLKLFEYMAAGRPIVASDLNVLREVLTDSKNALLTPPDDPASLAERIGRVLDDDELYCSLASAARRDVKQYTWNRRAQNIFSFIDTL